MERITSRTNPLLTHIRRLAASGSYRRQCGEYLGDSPKLLQEALLWKAELVCVVHTGAAELPPLPADVRMVEVPADIMTSVSPMKTPQGVLFTCRISARALPEKLTGRRYAVLEGPRWNMLPDHKAPHSWFAGFVDSNDLPLAFVALVENGGGGSAVAGSAAAQVLRTAAELL